LNEKPDGGLKMNTYALVYAFLAIAMGAMVYVIGTPWWTPKSREIGYRESQNGVIGEKML
jgi:hypothetical protein